MARFAVTLNALQPVTTEVIVEADDADSAYAVVATLFDRFTDLDWEPDGSATYEDMVDATQVDDDWALTNIRQDT